MFCALSFSSHLQIPNPIYLLRSPASNVSNQIKAGLQRLIAATYLKLRRTIFVPMSHNERIRSYHTDPGAISSMTSTAVRMGATGHLVAEDDEGNCEYKWRLTGITDERFQHLVTQMKFRVGEGHGRCVYEIGVADDGAAIGLCDADYTESLATVRRMAEALGFQVRVAFERIVWQEDPIPVGDRSHKLHNKTRGAGGRIQRGESRSHPNGEVDGSAPNTRRRCAEIHVTRRQKRIEDLRIAFCGVAGSGKSTLVGVLTQGGLDDGCGSVRSTIFNHKHEVDAGHTSSVAHHVMGFDAAGNITNYDEAHAALPCSPLSSPTLSSAAAENLKRRLEGPGAAESNGIAEGVNTIDYALNATRTIAERSVKLVTLLDLGGNEKYSKTAYFGITSKGPGYACIVVAADVPLVEGLALHVSMCLAMSVPFCIVVTKCDGVGELELDDLQYELDAFVRAEGKHTGHEVRTRTCAGYDDALDEALLSECVSLTTVPVFLTSCVDGTGVGYVKTFFNKLPAAAPPPTEEPAEILIDECFNVPGTGPVLGGFVAKGTVHEGQPMLMGPDRHGHFQPVTVLGIHEKGSHVTHATAGTDATFCVGHVPSTVDANRKGTVMLGVGTVHPQVCMAFECRVRAIAPDGADVVAGQEPILHCRNIRQAVRITAVTGVGGESTGAIPPKGEGAILCRFLYHPEILECGSTVLLRWNRSVRLVGTVSRLVEVSPITSPNALATPTDAFRPNTLPSDICLEDASTRVSSEPRDVCGDCEVDDTMSGGELFGDESALTRRRRRGSRGHRSTREPGCDHGQSNSPSSEGSSNEVNETIGEAVVHLFGHNGVCLAVSEGGDSIPETHGETRTHSTTVHLTPDDNTHALYNCTEDEGSRSPKMPPCGTAEYAFDE